MYDDYISVSMKNEAQSQLIIQIHLETIDLVLINIKRSMVVIWEQAKKSFGSKKNFFTFRRESVS